MMLIAVIMTIKPMHIIFFGATLAVVGSLITAYGTFKQNQLSSVKTDSIKLTGEEGLERIKDLEKRNELLQSTTDALNDELVKQSQDLANAYRALNEKNEALASKSDQIIDSTSELTKAQAKLIRAQGEIERLQNEMINHSIGKDSKPIVVIHPE